MVNSPGAIKSLNHIFFPSKSYLGDFGEYLTYNLTHISHFSIIPAAHISFMGSSQQNSVSLQEPCFCLQLLGYEPTEYLQLWNTSL